MYVIGQYCYRTISIVKSTASPNIEDREAIDPFSWVILTPVFGSINRGDAMLRCITSQWPVTVASVLLTLSSLHSDATTMTS